jgi:hypothetical protein
MVAAIAAVRGLCKLLSLEEPRAGAPARGRFDEDDFDADELGLDPEDDYDA